MFAMYFGRSMSHRCLLQVVRLEDRTVPVAGYFRIVSYNTTSASGAPAPGLDTLMQGFSNEQVNGVAEQIDIIAIQEVQNQVNTSQVVVNQLNALYGAGVYARGSLNGGTTGSGTQGVIYNQLKLQLLTEVAVGTSGTAPAQPRQALRYKFHPIGYSAVNDFYIYNSHYKADTSTVDQDRRNTEAMAIRANADSLGNGANIIYLGDFNVYTSTEECYQTLLSPGNGQAFDPINTSGSWHESTNAAFRPVFTQAPAVSPPGGLTGGGLDDRFDFQLRSGELADGTNLEYVANTYHVFGNNGSISVNGNINDPTSTALPLLPNRTTLLDLLTTVSDHLPVIADYRIVTPPTVTGTQINDGSAQRSRVTSLKVTFNQAVTLPGNPASAFTLVRQGGGNVNLSGTVAGNSVTLNFTGGSMDFDSLADGRYTLTALASQINGGNFDGNGDGAAGDNYVFASAAIPSPATNIFRVFGDSDGDGIIAASDFIQFRLALGGTSVVFDFDGDGSVSASDFVQFRLRFGGAV